MARNKQPEITIDDFHPRHDGFVQTYKGTWKEQGMIAAAWLDTVERDHFPRGLFLRDAYELSSTYERFQGGPASGARQEELGAELARALRGLMETGMKAAGWQVVGKTKEGRDIWQHRPPAPSVPLVKGERESGVQYRTRLVSTRAITFTCVQCGQEVTEQRFPSHTPLYCSNPACKQEANRVKTRERVAKYRQLHPDARKKKRV